MTEPFQPEIVTEPMTKDQQIAYLEGELRAREAHNVALERKISELGGDTVYARLERAEKARDEAAKEAGRLLIRLQAAEDEKRRVVDQAAVDQAMVSRLIVERNARSQKIERLEAVQVEVSETLAPLTATDLTSVTKAEITVIATDARDKLDGKKPIDADSPSPRA